MYSAQHGPLLDKWRGWLLLVTSFSRGEGPGGWPMVQCLRDAGGMRAPTLTLCPSPGRRDGPAVQCHGAQGAAQALPGRRGLWQPPLLPGAHQQCPGLCRTEGRGGLRGREPGAQRRGAWESGEGMLTGGGVGRGPKRERGLEV